MGAGGMIVCRSPNANIHRFFWNMKDHQVLFNENLNQGIPVDWTQYYPNYFTINGNSNPYINEDSDARVTGSVGDTIYIYMVNTGQSLHSIHLHGYHGEIIQSSKFPSHVGRSKDTVPVYSMEVVILKIVPDQPGEYPVHDHNLVAVSGGNIYPNGMFLTMLIN
jgi:FtsP/CotA-like multicopper oxidase with cupredoxin domain